MSNYNEELFNAYVSEEFRKQADLAQQEIQQEINVYIGEFKAHLNQVTAELESKDYVSDFNTQAEAALSKVASSKTKLEEVERMTAELLKKAPELKQQVERLSAAQKELKTELDNVENRVTDIGRNVGKFVATGIKTVINGGLPSF